MFLKYLKQQKGHLFYASGNMGKAALSAFFDFFALIYLTDVLSLSPLLAGNLLLMSMIWDGISDPIIAMLIDKLRAKFDKVTLYFLIGTPLTACFALGFFSAYSIPAEYLLPYLVTCLLFYRTAYTIVDVPHNSLLSFISKTPQQRTTIASMRIFFSAAGRFIVTLLSVHFLTATDVAQLNAQLNQSVLLVASFFLLIIYLCWCSVRTLTIVHENEIVNGFSINNIFLTISKNKPLCLALCLAAVSSLTSHAIGSALLYFSKYALGNEAYGGRALAIMSAAQAFSLMLWVIIANSWLGKYRSAQYSNALLVLAMCVGVSYMSSLWLLYLVATISGIALGGIHMLNWSIFTDTLHYNAALKQRRYDVTLFGLFTLICKICHGFSIAYVGWVLSFFEYVADSQKARADIFHITSVILTFPLVGGLCCIGLLMLIQKKLN